MRKIEIIKEVAKQTNSEVAPVEAIIESFISTVKESLARKETVHLRSFGSFKLKKRARKVARNISRNTPMIIPEHFIPSFKPARKFSEKIKKLPTGK